MIESKENYFVKNTIITIMMIILIVSLSGCNDSSSDIVNEYNNETSSDSITTGGNDSFATADSISLDTYYNYSISSDTDVDYYSITVEAGSSVEISLANMTEDLDLYTYNDSEEIIYIATNRLGDETIIYTAPTTSTIYIKVSPAFGGISDYTLTVSTITDTTTYDNDTFSTATPIELDTSINETILSVWHSDYYSTTVTAGSTVCISLTNMTENLNLYVYNSSQDLIESSIKSSTSEEVIYYTAVSTSTIYIRVAPYTSAPSDYTLTTTTLTTNSDYNENFATATPIEFDTTYNDSISTYYDKDYYSISLEAGNTIDVTIAGMPTSGLEIKIYNDSEDLVTTEYCLYSSETIRILASTSATVYIKVSGYDYQYMGEYTLTVVDANLPIELNDTFETATPVEHNTTYSSSISIATYRDKDYYSTAVAAGSTVNVTITNMTTGYFYLDLYDGSGNHIESRSSLDTETISYTSPSTSTIYIKVHGYLSNPGDYELTVTDT